MYSLRYQSPDNQNERITFCQSLHYQLLKAGSMYSTVPGELLYLTEMSKHPGSLTALCGNIFAKRVLILVIQGPLQKEQSTKD
jgi:hypothetical protein